jgi:hypothetical protein
MRRRIHVSQVHLCIPVYEACVYEACVYEAFVSASKRMDVHTRVYFRGFSSA